MTRDALKPIVMTVMRERPRSSLAFEAHHRWDA
jgi:hypothetical protein